nr:AAA family ATPase [Rhabdothermincola salaria]
MVGGYAGSGKTELAKVLASRTRWALIDKDTLTRPLVEEHAALLCGDPDDRQTDIYLEKIRPLEYRILLDTVNEVLDLGASLVVTAPFLRELRDPDFYDWMDDRRELDGISVHLVWVHADLDTMRRRLTHRGAGRDRWKLANWDAYRAAIDLSFRPEGPHDVFDNSLDGEGTIVDHAASLLQAWGLVR